MVRRLALALTALTGFTGLVYEVAWHKYLARLLGSHGEATAAVLALFLGGLSWGYVLFGGLSERIAAGAQARRRLLRAYAAVEAGIGAFALGFPWLFRGVESASLAIPAGSDAAAFAISVALAALLLVPAAILMGGTIPLLTQCLSRDVADATPLHARIYASNTAGAFAGALAAGFFVLPALGLAGSVRAVGAVNLAVGLLFAVLARRAGDESAAAGSAAVGDPAPDGLAWAVAASAGLAGFATMTLQTTLNRLGALSLGASEYTFSIVVATFVLGIALGSLAVTWLPRIRAAHLVASQWLLAAYLTALYPWIENAPYFAHAIRSLFQDDPGAFHAYHLALLGALFAVAALPLALSGALLPLLFHQVGRRGERLGSAAGRLYGWNTLGSLAGALGGGYALLFWLDLHHVYRLAVFALAGGAAILTATLLPLRRPHAVAACAGLAALLAAQPGWEPRKLALGTFRHHGRQAQPLRGADDYFAARDRQFANPDFVLFYDDDPSTTAAVVDVGTRDAPIRAIVNNGKSDGAVPSDDLTTGLLSLLPVLMAERAERAFVVGYGTGMSVGELAALDSVEEVFVAEISSAVLAAAPLFEELVRPAADHPKTRIVQGDAYRVLRGSARRYDVIVSEPSNPWTTGVEMLYSEDFLRVARSRLRPGGVYAQWFHTYETDTRNVELVLNTYRRVFDRVAVWYGRGIDLILLGFEESEAARDLEFVEARFADPGLRRQLAGLGIGSLPALLAHEVLPIGVTAAANLAGTVHTLDHPRLSHRAARAFFAGGQAALPPTLDTAAARAGARNSLAAQLARRHGGQMPPEARAEWVAETCRLDLDLCATLLARWRLDAPSEPRLAEALARARAHHPDAPEIGDGNLAGLAGLFDPSRLSDRPHDVASARGATAVFERYYHHAEPFDARSLRSIWSRCVGAGCASGALRAHELGVPPPPRVALGAPSAPRPDGE